MRILRVTEDEQPGRTLEPPRTPAVYEMRSRIET